MVDRELENRVWQRIRGEDTSREDLRRLLWLNRMQQEDLRYLDRELHRRAGMVHGLLTGLQALWGEHYGGAETGARDGSRQQRLHRCRDRCGEMVMLCVRLEHHPRYGGVFTDLTRYLRADCARLEQLLPRDRSGI